MSRFDPYLLAIGTGTLAVAALSTYLILGRDAPEAAAHPSVTVVELPSVTQALAVAPRSSAVHAGIWHAPSERDGTKCRSGTCPSSSYVNDVDSDLHVIGVYEPRESEFDESGKFVPGGEVVVVVHETPRPIDLVLTSYEPVQWRIVKRAGARVRSIRYHSDEPNTTVVGAPATAIAVESYRYRWEAGSDGDGDGDFGTYIAQIRSITGSIEAEFQGAYEGHSFHVPFASTPRAARQREQAELRRVEQLPKPSAAALAEAERSRSCSSEPCAYPYVLVDSGIRDLRTGVEHRFPPAIATLSWKSGIALDTKRQRVVVVSYGGVGAAVAFDLRTQRWSVIGSMRNVDVGALAYDVTRDVFWATTKFSDRAALLQFSPELTLLPALELDVAIAEVATLAMADDKLVAYGTNQRWVIDPKDGTVAAF